MSNMLEIFLTAPPDQFLTKTSPWVTTLQLQVTGRTLHSAKLGKFVALLQDNRNEKWNRDLLMSHSSVLLACVSDAYL